MRGKVLSALLVLLSVAGTAGARWGFPDPLTPRGQLVESIYSKIAVAGILVFLLVFALLVFILIRFREGSGHGRATHEKHRGSLAAELAWTIVPLLVVLWVGYIAYAGLVTLDKGNENLQPEMTVHITGVQWAWQMDYGGGVKVNVVTQPDAHGNLSYSDTFHLPADIPIAMNLTGGDVIHAFNILDADRAYFSMDDANPLGPHKYHNQTQVFPAGKYLIQCKEMCLNPGHGYMRAQLVVEPKADFELWLKERQLEAGHALVSHVAITADAGGLHTKDNLTIVKGTRVIADVQNSGSSPLTLSAPGADPLTIPAGGRGFYAFDVPNVGDAVLSGGTSTLTFHAIDAKVVDVTLASYSIAPANLQLEKGQTYLIRVAAMDSVHNYYLGHWDGSATSTPVVIANSLNVAGGGSTSFVFTPSESGAYDAWCNVSGHYGLGMHAHATVS
jgi:heme/copper-type cytochrome/quinol oxidase subunit 2